MRYSNNQSGVHPRTLDADREVDIKLRIFIPSPAIEVNALTQRYFAGDGRGFSYDQGTSRAEVHIKVRPLAEGMQLYDTGEYWRYAATPRWGMSHEYDAANVRHIDGEPPWWWAPVDGAQPTASERLMRSTDNLYAEPGGGSAGEGFASAVMGNDLTAIRLYAAGNLPLISGSPDIDCNLVVSLSHFDGVLHAKVDGSHDGFPAYELYVDGQRIYAHDPKAEEQTGLSLLPPAEFGVDTDWIAIDGEERASSLSTHRLARSTAFVGPVLDSTDWRGLISELVDHFRRRASFVAGTPDTSFFPFSAVCHLRLQFSDGWYVGSGFYVGRDMILTAGHNFYDAATGEALKAQVRVGRNGSTQLEYFEIEPDDWEVHPNYLASEDITHDLCVIYAKKPVPNNMHFRLIDYSPDEQTPIAVSGYASGSGAVDNTLQHLDIDHVRGLSSGGEMVEYNLQTLTGSSGSPVFVGFDNTMSIEDPMEYWRVMGVHTRAPRGAAPNLNRGVLLTPSKIDWVLGGGRISVAQGLRRHARTARPLSNPAQMIGHLPLVVRSPAHVAGLPLKPAGKRPGGTMSAGSSNGGRSAIIANAVNNGATVEEATAFLDRLMQPQTAPATAQRVARPLSSETVHLPGSTVLSGWQAALAIEALDMALGTVAGPLFQLFGGVDTILDLCDATNTTIGLGISGGGAFGGGAYFGAGVVFAPDRKIGFYGSASGAVGWIYSLSASLQVTIVDGDENDFAGEATVAGGTLDLSEGPGVGVHVILDDGNNPVGLIAELSLSLGIPLMTILEAGVQKQFTTTTFSLSHRCANERRDNYIGPI